MTYFTTTVEHLFDVESFLKTSGAQYQHHLLDDKNVLLRITNFNPTMLDEKLFQKWGELYWMSRKINFTNESDLKSFIEKTTVPVEGAQIFKKEYLALEGILSETQTTPEELCSKGKIKVEDGSVWYADLSRIGLGNSANINHIGSLPELKVLYIAGNNLPYFPPAIECLQKLEELYGDDNDFYCIPEELGDLPNLEKITVDGNKIMFISRRIFSLPRLKVIYAGCNENEKIPAEIGNCAALERAYFDYNKLTDIPEELLEIKTLKEVDL